MSKLINEETKEKTTIVRSQDKQHIFEFTKEYETEGTTAIVITLFSESDNTTTTFDRTKYFTFINLASLGNRKITLFNLFTKVNESFKSASYSDADMKSSLTYLKTLLEQNYDYIIVAVGSSHCTEKKVKLMKKFMYELLLPYAQQNKVFRINDNMGLYDFPKEQAPHPLYCGNYMALRWKLLPYDVDYALQDLIESEKRAEEMAKKLSGSKSIKRI